MTTACRRIHFLAALAIFLLPSVAHAELISLEIFRRVPFAEGKSFGAVGPYDILQGVAHFAVDPANERNRLIVDLALAPRNKDGKVEFESDVFILAPRDITKGNGAIFYDVNNRGNKLALRFFNDAPGGNNPWKAADAGNGFLMRQGYTVVWCGWSGELLAGDHRLLLKAPVAIDHAKPIRGLVRFETTTNKPAYSLPLSMRGGHGNYSPTKEGEAKGVLTWRMRETDVRIAIPRAQWSLERLPIPRAGQGVQGTLAEIRLKVAGGFRPGYLYELVCEAEGPIVQGLGFAAVRDLMSFLKHGGTPGNPFRDRAGKPVLRYAYGFGVSQSGRFLRHFTYQGFNLDEQERKVFDGLMPHVSGGGLGFFNHRFAQPTRHNAQHEEHLYPTDVFPFTYTDTTDPFTKRTDGILHRLTSGEAKGLPKILHTQSAAEYWHRSGSLVHTDPLGQKDATIPENVRIYAFGGTQHGPAGFPPTRGLGDNLNNPGDYRPLLRALLVALNLWVREGKAPPPSAYPRLDQKTLVDWRQTTSGFPSLPGVRYPEVIQQPRVTYFGPRFLTEGIITIEPPQVRGSYTVLVPRSDKDGNDLGTLLIPDVAVPLATFTGWNLRRHEFGAEAMLVSLTGSYIPFAKTRADRLATGDPRLSLAERYGSFDTYQNQYRHECERLVRERYLLAEDRQRLIEGTNSRRPLFPVPAE
jgi:hypothetical protein